MAKSGKSEYIMKNKCLYRIVGMHRSYEIKYNFSSEIYFFRIIMKILLVYNYRLFSIIYKSIIYRYLKSIAHFLSHRRNISFIIYNCHEENKKNTNLGISLGLFSVKRRLNVGLGDRISLPKDILVTENCLRVSEDLLIILHT